MNTWKTLLSFMLLLSVLSCKRGDEEQVLIPEDGDGTEETLAMSFNLNHSLFTANVIMDGSSFQTSPEETRCFSDDITQTALRWDFRFLDNNGTPTSITIEPVELTGKVYDSVSFDCDVSLKVDKNNAQMQYAAHVSGSLQYLVSYKDCQEYGDYKGEILVTWKNDEGDNQFHIVKFSPGKKIVVLR